MTRANPRIKPYILRVYLGSLFAFVLVKGLLRPWVLENEFWIGLNVFVLSFPNLVEAIVGLSNIYGLILYSKHRGVFWLREKSDRFLLFMSAVLAGIYVLTQEFGLHNLGGNNVPDLYDAGASVLGIVVMMAVFSKYGFFVEG